MTKKKTKGGGSTPTMTTAKFKALANYQNLPNFNPICILGISLENVRFFGEHVYAMLEAMKQAGFKRHMGALGDTLQRHNKLHHGQTQREAYESSRHAGDAWLDSVEHKVIGIDEPLSHQAMAGRIFGPDNPLEILRWDELCDNVLQDELVETSKELVSPVPGYKPIDTSDLSSSSSSQIGHEPTPSASELESFVSMRAKVWAYYEAGKQASAEPDCRKFRLGINNAAAQVGVKQSSRSPNADAIDELQPSNITYILEELAVFAMLGQKYPYALLAYTLEPKEHVIHSIENCFHNFARYYNEQLNSSKPVYLYFDYLSFTYPPRSNKVGASQERSSSPPKEAGFVPQTLVSLESPKEANLESSQGTRLVPVPMLSRHTKANSTSNLFTKTPGGLSQARERHLSLPETLEHYTADPYLEQPLCPSSSPPSRHSKLSPSSLSPSSSSSSSSSSTPIPSPRVSPREGSSPRSGSGSLPMVITRTAGSPNSRVSPSSSPPLSPGSSSNVPRVSPVDTPHVGMSLWSPAPESGLNVVDERLKAISDIATMSPAIGDKLFAAYADLLRKQLEQKAQQEVGSGLRM